MVEQIEFGVGKMFARSCLMCPKAILSEYSALRSYDVQMSIIHAVCGDDTFARCPAVVDL